VSNTTKVKTSLAGSLLDKTLVVGLGRLFDTGAGEDIEVA
jgi:hypothetical protein